MYPKNTHKIMEFLLRNTAEEFNVNQISRQLKISVGGAHWTLKKLLGEGLISQKNIGNGIYYQLNLENPETRKRCELILLESKNKALSSNPSAKIYVSDIEKASGMSKVIILFGSVIDKKERARDIDVLFLVEKRNIKHIEKLCLEISQIRTKTVNPLFMTEQDFRKNIKNDEITKSILKKGIVISGEEALVHALRGI